MSTSTSTIEALANQEYKYGFVTDVDVDAIPKGLNEDVIRMISAKKREPEFMLEWRLKAYRHWAKLQKGMQSRRGLTSRIRPSTTRTSCTTRHQSRRRL